MTTDWYWKQMYGDEDDSHLSTGAWAHRHRDKKHQALRFRCLTCNAEPRQHCRTYEGIGFWSDKTAPHVYRWNQLRKEVANGRATDKHLEVSEVQADH